MGWFGPTSLEGKPDCQEVVETTIRTREWMGYIYPEGTLADAIAAARAVSTTPAKIAAIENVLKAREQNGRPR